MNYCADPMCDGDHPFAGESCPEPPAHLIIDPSHTYPESEPPC